MKKGDILRAWLFIVMLSMTACTHTQPKIEKEKKVSLKDKIKINKKVESIKLTKLSTTLKPKVEWVPLKIEEEVEWNAKELLGKKYVWGATGPHTYDCSGFTQKIYDDLGIRIPRISRHQAKHGKLIKFAELQKGDLVFFHTNRRRPGKVTHVGIYLGNGDFIHASSSAKKIVICNFKKDCFYKKKFLWGRRVIDANQHIASKNITYRKVEKSL